MTNLATLFSDDPERGAEYFGECALLSMNLMRAGWPGVTTDEVAARATLAASYAIKVLEARADAVNG